MKNLFVFPTEKPSILHLWTDEKGTRPALCELDYSHTRNTQNIYITSDEVIKVGDYRYSLLQNNFELVSEFSLKVNKEYWKLNNQIHKKIILTTDPDLIKDGVQAIDDDFLEWFVKNPSCEEVQVYKVNCEGVKNFEYKIIIPKEENIYDEYLKDELKKYKDVKTIVFNKPKQETLEEAAERIYDDNLFNYEKYRAGFIEGAKWRQEVSQDIVPFDAYNIEVFKIEADENGELFAYIGYRITNGNFHFSVVPFTEPQQDKNKYSEEEVELIANEMVNWAIANIGNPNPQSGKKFDEVIAKFKNK